jgi:dephospho-CoA kinase
LITSGLTGGICCGKSTVSKTLIKHNIPVVDADIVARQVVEPNTYGLKEITYHFGSEVLESDGSLNRSKLGEKVFSEPNLKARGYYMHLLNSIMGPLIQEESTAQINKLHAQGHNIVCYDAALIAEMNNADKYRPLIVVSCPIDIQLARLMKRNNLTHEQAMDRISIQMSLEQKVAMADYVIDTTGTIESSIKQTELIIEKLKLLQEKSL